MTTPSVHDSSKVLYQGAVNPNCTFPKGQKFKPVGVHQYALTKDAQRVFVPCSDEEAETGYYTFPVGASAQCKKFNHIIVDPANKGQGAADLSKLVLTHTVPEPHVVVRLWSWLNKS